MNCVKFNIYQDLEKVNASSLLIESEQEVASLQVNNIYVSLMCYGTVEVDYKNKTYYSAKKFPKIVTDYFLGKIKDKELLEDLEEDIWIEDKNYFLAEVFIVEENKGNKLKRIDKINDYEDEFDIESYLDHYELSKSEMLYSILLRHLKNLKRDYQDEVKELQELNLDNL